jgi:hypothetical protein
MFAKKTEKSPMQRMFDALGSPLHTFAYEYADLGKMIVAAMNIQKITLQQKNCIFVF